MTNSDNDRARELQDAIRMVLLNDWDPIGIRGVGPDDEYDCYIEPVYRLLTGNRSESDLTEFLFLTARDTIGVACETTEHFEQMRPIARRLLELNVPL